LQQSFNNALHVLPTPHTYTDMTEPNPQTPGDVTLPPLLNALRSLIVQARQQVLRHVDVVQVQTYWEIGKHILEFEQGGQSRAAYGKRLLPQLGQTLSQEFGKGFDATNLRHMRGFFLAFPKCDALRRELSWTHYRLLLRVDAPEARQWYMQEAAVQNWSTRVLERHLGTLYYERLLSSQDKGALIAQTQASVQADLLIGTSPRDFVRDPVMLEFLGLPGLGRLLESDLERALMDKLQHFLLELGKGFAFVGRQQRISTETQDFYVDLVFYNYLLKCFVLIDLKTGHLTHQDMGRWTCMCACMTICAAVKTTTRRWEFCCVAAKTIRWCATQSCTKANKCSPANTAWFCLAKKSCARS
jgi:predicted nuclease of restriction endonuclease-like (RecB) superfamily